MGKFAKLVDTEEKIVQFKSRYGIPEDVHIRYVPYGDLALLQRQDLVLPIVAIVEGGVRIPMHTFLLRFLTHFRLNPLQCAPNVFRIVMGTAVLMEKLGLNLTVHDITYMYSLQTTGKDQYTLVARNADRKLVTGLPDSSKSRDEDFLVFTGNWQNPHINCPLKPGVPDKEFTAKKVELVERKTVEHLLKRPCFIDSGGRPRVTSILLDYVPSYKSFQKGPTVKHFRQEEITVVRPGKDQEDIIQAVPVTARRGVQVPQLVPPLSNPEFVPSLESSEVGLPIIQFPSVFYPDPNPTEEMPIQKRSINISSVLGTSAPEPSGTSPPASAFTHPLRFSQGEEVMRKKRKRGEEQSDDVGGQEGNRAVDEGDSVLKSGKGVRGGEVAEAVGKALLLPEDMKVWQEKRSKHMLENLKRDSILAVQGIFEAGSRLLETERRLQQSQEEIKSLKEFEESASAKIRAAESAQKSAEAGLLNMENQVTELKKKLDWEYKSASQVRVENSQLKDALTEAEAKVQKAEEHAQAYYDQGFNEAADSLQSQVKGECNKYYIQGWHKALDRAGVDDASKLYDLALRHQPFGDHVPEERNEEAGEDATEDSTVPWSHEALSEPVLADDPEVTEGLPDDQIQTAEFQEGEDGSDFEENIDVID
uniref:Transposase (putative) gypsy type domain-containing protein n=1 Tax=Fagus sylvatica TaxID=28930 RepID=A0A2N9IHI8_FAGSY